MIGGGLEGMRLEDLLEGFPVDWEGPALWAGRSRELGARAHGGLLAGLPPARRSGSPRTSCRNGPAARGASTPCCRFSTCAASPPATSGRRSPPFSEPRLPNLSPGVISRLTARWGRNTSAGNAATSRLAATSTSGPTGSTFRPGWSPRRSASWWCRGHARGEERAARLPCGDPGKRTKLARAPGRPQGPGSRRRARDRRG